jgi:hypothetical protein
MDAAGQPRPMFDPFGILESDQPSMTPDEYDSSKYYRKEIPWEPGLTEDRAAAKAQMFDTKAVRAHFSEKQPIAAFLGGFVGQAFDPVNYIPVFSPVAHTAAIAKFGSIGGRVLMGASDAAINTAAFGILTSGIREKYGDDVSFAAITNEVAMSALIGGVFGAGIGVMARGGDAKRRLQEAKVRDALDTIKTTQQAMIPLGEAAARLASDGEVRLSPNGLSVIERIRAEATTRDISGRALETETAGVTGTRAGEIVVTPSGHKVNVRPEVVELDSLIPATGALQVRNRATAASAAQVEQIATGLDPARLMPNISADQGAPLVGDDNIIDSGNGRVMAIKRAYEAYPERAEAYRQALADAGYDVSQMRNPVLVQRRVTPLSPDARSQFNADANSSSTARMSAVEIAEMDRAAITDEALDVLDAGPITAAGNRAFVARFLANLPANERTALVDRGGALSADGARRIENALVASAYADVDAGVLRRFAEATDDNTRSIVGAMADVAGRWARMRRAIGTGEVSPEFDTTPELTGALRALGGWRDQAAREGRPVSVVIREGMAQMDLLGGELSPEAQIFVRMFYKTDQFSQVVGREALAARLDRVIESTMELGKPQLFADAIPTKAEVIRNATDGLETDLFAPDSVVGRAQEDGQSGEPARAGAAGEANRPGTGTGAEGERVADPAPGLIRFYHGTRYENAADFEGKTSVTPHEAYARDYRGGPNNVLYTDLTRDEAIAAGLFDEINGFPINGSINDGAARLKPLINPTGRPAEPTRSLFPEAQPVNGAEPRPDPPIEGLDAAAARVGTGEDMKALAAQFGVDDAGGFVEQADIDRLKELGRLTPEEIDALEIADQQFEDAVQYGETLKYIAATCGVRG